MELNWHKFSLSLLLWSILKDQHLTFEERGVLHAVQLLFRQLSHFINVSMTWNLAPPWVRKAKGRYDIFKWRAVLHCSLAVQLYNVFYREVCINDSLKNHFQVVNPLFFWRLILHDLNYVILMISIANFIHNELCLFTDLQSIKTIENVA